MNQSMLSQPLTILQHAKAAFDDADYSRAALLYEQLVEQDPQIHYIWHLGLARLLAGQESEAQFTWMMVFSNSEPEQVEQWTAELAEILDTASEHQETAESWNLAWAVRQYLRELDPTRIHNLLHLVRLATKLNLFNGSYLESLELTELLQSEACPNCDTTLLVNAALDALECQFEDLRVQAFAEAALAQAQDTETVLGMVAEKTFALNELSRVSQLDLVTYLIEVCLHYAPNDIAFLQVLSTCHEKNGRYLEAIAIARRCLEASQTPQQRMSAIALLCMRLLKTGSAWNEVQSLFEQQQVLLPELIKSYCPDPDQPLDTTLLTFSSFYTYYLKDAPAEHRPVQNQLAELLQRDLQFQAQSVFQSSPQRFRARAEAYLKSDRKLKIGYLARYMSQHPVGWIARWLMKYHDYSQFDIYTYHLHVTEVSDFTNSWFVKPVTRSAKFEDGSWAGIAKHICENDEIDILVDLDSITYTEACNVMALKPAPIQLTWMGFDASGLPSIDYYIADPYVLPDSAQSYYTEKIWRLPNTYLAVDGYEVAVPTLRRDHLNIPMDAVIYLSAQDGRKRHPEMMHLQIQILREVPNSYLLLKGLGDETSIKQAFVQIAEEEGVSPDRLRFLGRDINETVHRANLGIADVVLDTFPYNGASTTLETLWVGVPVVTRVGQQWAARNSYTMLKNVGVEEGIAWTDEQYLEWGIRLGRDAKLRQNIHIKLLQSRQTSPLWNTKQFAREIENAYQQMWQNM